MQDCWWFVGGSLVITPSHCGNSKRGDPGSINSPGTPLFACRKSSYGWSDVCKQPPHHPTHCIHRVTKRKRLHTRAPKIVGRCPLVLGVRESRLFLQLATLTSCSSLAASKVGAILIRFTHQERPFCANSASSLSSCSFLAAPRVGAMSVRFAHQQRPFCANSASSWQWKPPCLFPAVPECCRPSSRRVCVAWWQGLFSSLHYPPCNSLCHYATVAHLARPGSSSHRHGRGRGRAVRAQRTLQAGHARHTFLTAHRTALRWFPPCSCCCEWLPCCGGQGGYPLTLLPLCPPLCHHRVT